MIQPAGEDRALLGRTAGAQLEQSYSMENGITVGNGHPSHPLTHNVVSGAVIGPSLQAGAMGDIHIHLTPVQPSPLPATPVRDEPVTGDVTSGARRGRGLRIRRASLRWVLALMMLYLACFLPGALVEAAAGPEAAAANLAGDVVVLAVLVTVFRLRARVDEGIRSLVLEGTTLSAALALIRRLLGRCPTRRLVTLRTAPLGLLAVFLWALSLSAANNVVQPPPLGSTRTGYNALLIFVTVLALVISRLFVKRVHNRLRAERLRQRAASEQPCQPFGHP